MLAQVEELGAPGPDDPAALQTAAGRLLDCVRDGGGAVAVHGGPAGGPAGPVRALMAVCLTDEEFGCVKERARRKRERERERVSERGRGREVSIVGHVDKCALRQDSGLKTRPACAQSHNSQTLSLSLSFSLSLSLSLRVQARIHIHPRARAERRGCVQPRVRALRHMRREGYAQRPPAAGTRVLMINL